MWAFAHSSRLRRRTAVRSRPRWGRRACRWASLRRFLTVCAEILWLCKPIVAAAVRVAGLRRSWRWRCWMWGSWAGVVTRGLRLWGRLDVLPNSLKRLWRRLMVEKWTFNSRATALVDIPAVSIQLHAPSELATSVALCCVIKLHILEWPFIVASLRHTCAIIMLSNQHLNMPHLNMPHRWLADLSGQMLTFDGVWHFGEVFSSRMNPGFHCTGQMQTACMASCGWAVFWCQHCGSSGPWWRWGYGMDRHMLWTTNTGAFYWWHFECTEILWRDPEAHCCAIHPRPSSHVAAW